MQSYLYIHPERIKGIYTQMVDGVVSKHTSEKSKGAEANVEGGFWSIFKTSVKGNKGSKVTVEKTTEPENMVAQLVQIVPETGWTRMLVEPDDWDFIAKGNLVAFRGKLEFDSYGLSKNELWDASYDKLGERNIRHDLRLKGPIGGRLVEIPFSSNWITGPSQFTVLCHAMFEYLEGLAVVLNQPDGNLVMMQPLAFGNGFVTDSDL